MFSSFMAICSLHSTSDIHFLMGKYLWYGHSRNVSTQKWETHSAYHCWDANRVGTKHTTRALPAVLWSKCLSSFLLSGDVGGWKISPEISACSGSEPVTCLQKTLSLWSGSKFLGDCLRFTVRPDGSPGSVCIRGKEMRASYGQENGSERSVAWGRAESARTSQQPCK